MTEIRLEGCHPSPLAHYLKALGILRLVGEQADKSVRGAWKDDVFVLKTRLSSEELCDFFLHRYQPTPIVAPWNGGSGFCKKDNKDALEAIMASGSSRFEAYRATIAAAEQSRAALGIDDKVGKEQKEELIELCRNRVPDVALPWLDAAVVLTIGQSKAKYPPLLGTGGNDGRLDFTNNFMQRVLELVDANAAAPVLGSDSLLRSALFDSSTRDLRKGAAIGQFFPGAAGGANAHTGFDADALINPWDFVLMLEGACSFAAAQSRSGQYDTQGALSYPFTVKQSGAGYGSAAASDAREARAEMWLPLWTGFASKLEIDTLLSEGRARVGKRTARNGVDFARAVACLGVDRGIDRFQRIGFQVRNGLAYFATPLATIRVGQARNARLLDEIDAWLDALGRASGDSNTPSSVAREVQRLESAILALCERGDSLRLQALLLQLGTTEMALARSQTWVSGLKMRLTPLPMLSAEWLADLDFGQVELRLALALAGLRPERIEANQREPLPHHFREHLEPVSVRGKQQTVFWRPDQAGDLTWTGGSLVDRLISTMTRRLMRSVQLGYAHHADRSSLGARTQDIAAFINREVDEKLLEGLIVAFSMVKRGQVGVARRRDATQQSPGAFYALLKLCYPGAGEPIPSAAGELEPPRLDPQIFTLAAAGRSFHAYEVARRRLRASGFVPELVSAQVGADLCRRSAAALLFPVSPWARTRLANELRPSAGTSTETQTESHESSNP